MRQRVADDGTTEAGRLRSDGRQRLASDVHVLTGVSSLLALLAVAVGLAVVLIVLFEHDATNETQRHVLHATAIHEAALSAKAIANHQRGFLLSGDPVNLNEIQTETARARSHFGEAASHATGASQRAAVQESRAGFEHWLRVMKSDLAAFRGGSKQQAIRASLGTTRQLRKTYEQSLANAYEQGAHSIETATNSLSSSASRSVTILLTYLALALVLGVAVALWVVRATLKPGFTLSQNAIEVLTQGRVLVSEDDRGSHHGVSVVVPIEVVNALAASALETQEGLSRRNEPDT